MPSYIRGGSKYDPQEKYFYFSHGILPFGFQNWRLEFYVSKL
jgi:hypothetical protein